MHQLSRLNEDPEIKVSRLPHAKIYHHVYHILRLLNLSRIDNKLNHILRILSFLLINLIKLLDSLLGTLTAKLFVSLRTIIISSFGSSKIDHYAYLDNNYRLKLSEDSEFYSTEVIIFEIHWVYYGNLDSLFNICFSDCTLLMLVKIIWYLH